MQPLKSVSALALARLPPVIIVTGAIWNALAFLGMGLAGLDRWVRQAFPKPVVRGIQLGLAWLLFKSAWKLVTKTPEGWQGGLTLLGQMVNWIWILAGGALICLMIFLFWKRDLAALGVVIFGIGASGLHLGLPAVSLHLTLPKLLPLLPTWSQLWQGLVILALPQIPLSLRQFFIMPGIVWQERNFGKYPQVSDLPTRQVGDLSHPEPCRTSL